MTASNRSLSLFCKNTSDQNNQNTQPRQSLSNEGIAIVNKTEQKLQYAH